MALLDPGIPNELYRLQHPAFEKQEENKIEAMIRFF